MIFLFIFLVLVCFLLFVWIKERYRFWTNRGFVSATGKFPFGNVKGVGRERTTAQALTELYNDYKHLTDCLGFFLLIKPAVLAISPEIIRDVLVKDFKCFHDRGMYYNKEKDPLSANLLTLTGDEWHRTRTKITPAFSTANIRFMFDTIRRISDTLVNVIQLDTSNNSEINVTQRLAEFATDVIGNVAFGLDCSCLEDPNAEVRMYGKKVFAMTPSRILKFFFTTMAPKLSYRFGIRATNQEASRYFMDVFRKTVEYREKNDVRRKDFLQILIDLRNSEEGVGLKLTELCSESFVFFAGGFETSSTTISFCLYYLAQNQVIQTKLRENIRKTLCLHEGEFTYDSIGEMKYLSMVVDETLRKNPSIPLAMRKCTVNYKIPNSNLEVPKGVTVMVPILAIHHDSQYYPSPEKFDPERFNEENVSNRVPYTYLPFGDGPRICVGMRFGLLQTKIAVAKIILNFEVSTCEKTEIPMKFNNSSPFMTPANDIYLIMKSL